MEMQFKAAQFPSKCVGNFDKISENQYEKIEWPNYLFSLITVQILRAGHQNLQNYLKPVNRWSGIENKVTNSMKHQNLPEIAAAGSVDRFKIIVTFEG